MNSKDFKGPFIGFMTGISAVIFFIVVIAALKVALVIAALVVTMGAIIYATGFETGFERDTKSNRRTKFELVKFLNDKLEGSKVRIKGGPKAFVYRVRSLPKVRGEGNRPVFYLYGKGLRKKYPKKRCDTDRTCFFEVDELEDVLISEFREV